MTTSENFKATWSGTLGADEIFSYSRYVSSLDGPVTSGVVGDALEDDVANMLGQAVLLGPIATIAQGFPSHVVWNQLKVSEWDATSGKLVVGTFPDVRALSEVGTGDTSHGLPFQCAWAITTRSQLTPSAREKNRFYLPPVTVECTNGQGTMKQPVIDAFSLWLTLGETALEAGTPSLSFSNYSHADGLFKALLDHYIGSRIDTIRRRRNHLVEARTIGSMA
jgi:hypothetical protein